MSQQEDDINKPLPRKSQEDSSSWAKKFVSAMARHAEVKISHDPAPRKRSNTCVGKNDEVPEDGRYTLTYTAYADLPADQHIASVRKLSEALKKHGVRITGVTERPETPEVILFGESEKEGYTLIADTVKPPNTLRLSVTTPCYLPPGAKQQQF